MLSLSHHLRSLCRPVSCRMSGASPVLHGALMSDASPVYCVAVLSGASPVYGALTLRIDPQHDRDFSTVAGEDTVSRITLPQRMLRRMDRDRTKQLIQQSRTGAASLRSRSGPVVIACKRSQFNHRVSHVYKDLRIEHLASNGWKHSKSKGDYFTINATQNNPSFKEVEPGRSTVRRVSLEDPSESDSLGSKPPSSVIYPDYSTSRESFDSINSRRQSLGRVRETRAAVPLEEGLGFKRLGLDKQLSEGLSQFNIHTPTVVQLKSIPVLLSGRNLLCTAETGSGKTLAYLLPLVDRIKKYNKLYGACQAPNRPYGLVLVPSRELAQQIHSVLCDLSQICPINADVKCGGNNTQRLLREAEQARVDVLVTTPGVFSKLLINKMYDLSRLSFVVVDEADSLLDDSFSGLTLHILQRLKVTSEVPVTTLPGEGREEGGGDQVGGTQIVFIGATLPRGLSDILGDIVPVDSIETVTTSHIHRVMPHVAQKFVRLGPSEKPVQLLSHLKSTASRRIPTLVFCNSSSTACYLGYFLDSNNLKNIVLHSRMPQAVREGRYDQFKNGEFDILICTDIASRGLNTVRARHVINYDFPLFMSDYVHRVGRVGRVGSDGSCFALTFVTYKWDVDLLWKIEMAIRKKTELHNVNANIKRKLEHRLKTFQETNSL